MNDNNVQSVPLDMMGLRDVAQLEGKCVYTEFRGKKIAQKMLDCTIMASWENGVLSVIYMDGTQKKAVGVRLDEIAMVMMESITLKKDADKEVLDGKEPKE